MNTHPSLLAGSYFAVSQIYGVAPKIKTHHSDTSMDSSIKIVRQREQVFDSYRTREKRNTSHKCAENKRKTLKDFKIFFLGGGG
jgi:hypothetical protein